MRTARTFAAILLVLLAALFGAPPAAWAQSVSSRTVSNVASIRWGAGGANQTMSSNRVDTDVLAPTATLTAFRPSAAGGSTQLDLAASQCVTPGGPVPLTLASGWQSTASDPASVLASDRVRVGEPIFVGIDFPSANRDPAAVDTIHVVITSPSGDQENLILSETEVNSSRFNGFIQTVPTSSGSTADCRLAVSGGESVRLDVMAQAGGPVAASANVGITAASPGYARDSTNGSPVSGVQVMLVNADTGLPVQVLGDDGTSPFPSALVTGQPTSDGGGQSYAWPPGGYRFPLVMPGRYRLQVTPPAPYRLSSVGGGGAPAGAAGVVAASNGLITLTEPGPVAVDIALTAAASGLLVTKTASQTTAVEGDLIQYRVTVRNADPGTPTGAITLIDRLPDRMRLRPGSVRVDGMTSSAVYGGGQARIALPPLAAGASTAVTYVLEVRPGARAGDAVNAAFAEDALGVRSNTASATVRIRRDTTFGTMTIIGRISDGGCERDGGAGVGGVRLLLEDGSYAITDADGRYHFEGVSPGLHVVQVDDLTLPADRRLVTCSRNTRSSGRAFSRFMEGTSGSLQRIDFRTASAPARESRLSTQTPRRAPASDAEAAAAGRDWLAGQAPGIGFLFPETGFNPRAGAIRVAVKHAPGQSVRLAVDGRPADPVAFDGTERNAAGTIAVSLWRGIPLQQRRTRMTADVINADGSVAERLSRDVWLSGAPIRAELLRDRSRLVADGLSRPVIAIRLTDRDGRPVRHGVTGEFELPAPYYPAVEAAAQQARQLAGLERARPFWRVEGDDGVAYIELEPTTVSGTLSLNFQFGDDRPGSRSRRTQRIDAWLDPGDRPWMIVGLAEGTVGFNRLDRRLEELAEQRQDVMTDGRVALYATGRIRGRWLMSLAYDSDRRERETRFAGTIDPDAYYTIYADRSERRYGASSARRLYLRLERPQFYAMFGDFETGIDEPQLARYNRSFTGVHAEYRSERVSATAFAAESSDRFGRTELQGNGLTGPYLLNARDLLPNSERVTFEIRDRLRGDLVRESRLLTRHIDYDIDYRAGTLRFREPILSRNSNLDPQFIVVTYEIDGFGGRSLNAGGRVAWRSADQNLQVAATAIHDDDGVVRTNIAGADLRYRPTVSTEIRAEVAASDRRDSAGSDTDVAWLVEAEHHGARYDLLAYARERPAGFGTGQLNVGEDGTRSYGVEGQARVTDRWSVSGAAWHTEYLQTGARRNAGRVLLEYRGLERSARAGLIAANDHLSDGRTATSTLVQLGATQRLLNNRLEIDAQTEIPIGHAESVDLPAQHRLTARYAVSNAISLIGAYEIADGREIDARTLRVGFDLRPWAGARLALTANQQDISEYGPRTFAAYGLSQSVALGRRWSLDFTLDGNRTLGGVDPARVLNPLHPIASGGFIGSGGLTEDFIAATAGATWRNDRWTIAARAEYRDGERDIRYGLTAGVLRQVGEGSAIGGLFNWFRTTPETGSPATNVNLQLSWAHRPAGSRWSWLEKFELRQDNLTAIGAPSLTGDAARSRRAINSLSVNLSPNGERGGSDISLFLGTRYVAQRFGPDDIKGWSQVVGTDIRFDLSDTIDFGASTSVRFGIDGRSFAWAVGPSIGITPFENGWLSVGWNVAGFHDRDFAEDRYTRSGPYVTLRLRFDQLSLAGLGLGPR